MIQLRNLFLLVFVMTALLTACEKDGREPANSNSPTNEQINTISETLNTASSLRALSAAAKSSQRSGAGPDGEENPCGCYDIFNEIDFDASDAEIDAAIEAALESLSEAEMDHIFEPVCTEDGQIYESACVADCEGVLSLIHI